MATPQGNRLHTPVRQIGGMGLQGFGINPLIGDAEGPRPAVGDQVQVADGLPGLPLLLQPPADPGQRMLLVHAGQHRQLRPCHQGLDLRTALVCHQYLLCGTGAIQG